MFAMIWADRMRSPSSCEESRSEANVDVNVGSNVAWRRFVGEKPVSMLFPPVPVVGDAPLWCLFRRPESTLTKCAFTLNAAST
jgi:hypothetical protein